MKELEKQIDAWIEQIKDEYVADVIGAVNIPSVSVRTEGPHPFGDACAKMLDYMEQTVKKYGFSYENHEYYCATSFFAGSEGKAEIGMFGHTDVVPAGEGWSCDPFDGHVDRGYIVGRGSNDNKGSTFDCVYAMRFFRENGIQLKNNVRLLYGCNEESGMQDIAYYGAHHKFPDITLVVDSWWPVSCSEKGMYVYNVKAELKTGNLREFETIGANNSVPNKCTCLLDGADIEQIKVLCAEQKDLDVREEAAGLRLTAYGIGKHSSFPEGSKSAVLVLARFLLDNALLQGDAVKVIGFVADSIADYEGKALNVDFRDDFAGNTTHVLTDAALRDGELYLTYKIGYPAAEGVDKEEIFRRLQTYFSRDFLQTVSTRSLGPHFVEKDHPVVKILCKNASNVLGRTLTPFSQAGGTYAWVTPNSFAAGPAIHGEEQTLFTQIGHGGAHQPDECMSIDVLLRGLKIYILSLLEIDAWLSGTVQ